MRRFVLYPSVIFALSLAGISAADPPQGGAGPLGQGGTEPRRQSGGDDVQAICEYGIISALNRDLGRADSMFVWMLSLSPGDPRALTNLGNVALLRGEADLALAFYGSASQADTSDPGIVLNAATASMLLGDEEGASARAAEGTRMAGGLREAASLLGLRYRPAEDQSPKAAAKTHVNRDELLALLRTAARAVPADSSAASLHGPGSRATSKRPTTARRSPTWRTAGARAGFQEVGAVVYWKR
jgi:hypothetical protein